jgi:GAF domain-containing protein
MTDPQIVGFDMPSIVDAHLAQEPRVLVAMLDGVPALTWQQLLLRESADFLQRRGLQDLRLIGANIDVVGEVSQLRLLPPALQDLVNQVSRKHLHEVANGAIRVRPGHTPGSFDTPQPATPAVTLREDVRQRDVAMVAAVTGVQAMLADVSRVTGMRFSAVARVTDLRWTACAVHDLLEFGLRPGQDLILESTICNEIRQKPELVAFNQASADPRYASHHTPALYGFQSYLSVPIMLEDGAVFGTLCALDPEPAQMDDAAIEQVKTIAATIGQALRSGQRALDDRDAAAD